MSNARLILPILTEADPSVTRVFIRRNLWDNYAVFVGSRKVLDGARKDDLIDSARERYPNAEVIDQTSKNAKNE